MTKILKIDTIHCPNCEKRVARALMNVEGVDNVIASFEHSSAYVKLEEDLSNENLIEAVEADGSFKVVEII